jgi:hypothetical protein
MSQYMIVINSVEKAQAKATVEQNKEVMAAYMKYSEELAASGAMRGGEALEPSSKGARISHKEGRRIVTDGPFAEAKEVVGGFYIIDVKTREEAIEWAAKCPGAKYGTVELREVRVFPK